VEDIDRSCQRVKASVTNGPQRGDPLMHDGQLGSGGVRVSVKTINKYTLKNAGIRTRRIESC
jgi:hypothetical protein